MKKIIVTLCALVVLSASPLYADLGPRHLQENGAYSFQPPAGWKMVEIPGLKYKIAAGPPSNSFSPNINVVDESYGNGLSAYVDENINLMKQAFVKLEILERVPFQTNDGVTGETVLTTSNQQKFTLRQRFHFLPGANNHFYVITCSSLADDGSSYESLFNQSVRTIKIEK